MPDDNEFFRDATLRICGNLVIEEALHASLLYIRDFIPADSAFLEYYDVGLAAIHSIAKADTSGGQRLNITTQLPEGDREKRFIKTTHEAGRVLVENRPTTNPIATTMLRLQGYDEESVSILGMVLISKGHPTGGIVFVAHGLDRYNEEHARLVSQLREPFTVALVNALQHRELARLRDRLEDDKRQLQRELLHRSGDEIVGADFGLRSVMQKVWQVAPTESPVLLAGETGVGKDVVANAIHLGSTRRDGPFVPVNCGAIPDSLLDSELFGHEKGAFTGALSMKRGRFERADKGTIFLDEIGEMPLDAQVRLLRVIQHREVERIGGTQRIPVDFRIIAATNQDLQTTVQTGRFREDLWFRLNVFPITVPPLRERTGDIPALVQHFIERKAKELKIPDTPQLAPGAVDDLVAYHWPGNVRELENLIERAMILYRNEPLRFDELRTSVPGGTAVVTTSSEEESLDLDSVVARHIRRVLQKTEGKVHGPGGAAEILGMKASTLRYRMNKLGIPYGRRVGDSR